MAVRVCRAYERVFRMKYSFILLYSYGSILYNMSISHRTRGVTEYDANFN